MKSILLSIRPIWVCEILNGRKTIEVRRKYPKDYVGWVYIYCTKGYQENKCLYKTSSLDWEGKPFYDTDCYQALEGNINQNIILNGKVVARFWCSNVEEIKEIIEQENEFGGYYSILGGKELLKKSCLTEEELENYLDYGTKRETYGYALHISKLEIFDRPKELSEFNTKKVFQPNTKPIVFVRPLKKSPQNYCFIEGEE